jgi:hypothetical protein
MSMDASVWEAIGDLRTRMKVVEQRIGVRPGGTMAVVMAEEHGYERPVRCPICDGSGTEEGATCRLCGGTGMVNSDADGESDSEDEDEAEDD